MRFLKKIFTVLLIAGLCGLEAIGGSWTLNFADPATLDNVAGKFTNAARCEIDSATGTLFIQRGKIQPVFAFTEPIGAKEDLSVSFEFTRLSKDSTTCFALGEQVSQANPCGILFIDTQGRLLVYGPGKRYEATGMVFAPGKSYQLTVTYRRDTDSVEINCNGMKPCSGKIQKLPDEIRCFFFTPQQPDGNRMAIKNLSFRWFPRGEQDSDNAQPATGAIPPALSGSWTLNFADPATLDAPAGKLTNAARCEIDSATGTLFIQRGKIQPVFAFAEPIGAKEDLSVSFEFTRLSEDSTTCFALGEQVSQANPRGILFINTQGRLLVYGPEGRYMATGMVFQPEKSYYLTVAYRRDTNSVDINCEGMKPYSGKIQNLPDEIRSFFFTPQKPEGNRMAIKNLSFRWYPSRVVTFRNALFNVPAEIGGGTALLEGASDGNLEASHLLPEKSVLVWKLPKRYVARSLQIFSGNAANAQNPSGALSLRGFKAEAYFNGAWEVLWEEDNAPDPGSDPVLDNSERLIRFDFAPTRVEQFRLTLENSYDTGLRMSGPVDERLVNIREIELITDEPNTELPKNFFYLVQADYRLPVYRDADRAEFHIVVADDPQSPNQAELSIALPDGKNWFTTRTELKPGENIITVPGIDRLPAGRYFSTLTTERGKLRRLLRVEHTPEILPPPEPVMMTGKKLFFTPDRYSLSQCENLSVKVFPPRITKHVQTPDGGDFLLLNGRQYYPTKDGKYALQVTDFTYGVMPWGSSRDRKFIADNPNGPWQEIDQLPPRQPQAGIFRHFTPAPFPKAPLDAKFELYDESRHGKMELGNLNFLYFYNNVDLGFAKVKPHSLWITGKTADGRWVMMDDKPLLSANHFIGEDDFDDGTSCNDNFCGIWLSADGTECYLGQGQTVKRSAPFVVPYDNLPTGMRLMSIFSTRDGRKWEYRGVMTAPDENDSRGAQHYGVVPMQIADGDLMLGYLLAYDSEAQQIYSELIYSRDLVNFHRFPGHVPWVRTTDVNEWYFGHAFIGMNIFRSGDRYYQQAGYCTPLPHFSAEVFSSQKSLAETTAQRFRDRFRGRGLDERWPHFIDGNGYDGLAERTRKGFYATGAIDFRADGWFGLVAGDQTGTFTTHRLCGGGKVYANIRVPEGGSAVFKLTDADGGELASAEVTGDHIRQFLFDAPAEGEYRISGTLKNAELYTIGVEK